MEASPSTVLVVDDRPENVAALRAVLERATRANYRILTATSGQEALHIALKEPLHVILLDVVMPDMDGFEVARHLKGVQRTRHIPIIFVTALATDEGQFELGHDLGAVDYLVKPFEPDVVRRKVAVFVELAEQREEIERLRVLEKQLAERRFLRVVEGAEDVLTWVLDETGALTFVSRQAERMFSEPTSALMPPGAFVRRLHDDDRDVVLDAFKRALDEGSEEALTHRMTAADGALLWFRTSVAREIHGERRELHGISTDITDVKWAEEMQTLIADVSAILGRSFDLDTALPEVARRLTPALGDACSIEHDGDVKELV